MGDDGPEEVKPAPYPESDKDEHDAISVLDYILDPSVKSHIESRDKDPNHDGWLELVDAGGSSTGRVVVQVKKLPDKHRDTPKKQVKTANLAYCRVCADPFILIAVDIEREVAYWKYISTTWFESEKLDNQTYKTVHLTDGSKISSNQTNYVSEWQSIIDDTMQMIDNRNDYEKLKAHSNPAIGEKRAEFELIHQFLDQYHYLLETDFEIVKKMLYPNIWKFGYGNIKYEKNSLHYALYPIEYNENDAQIRDIENTPGEVLGLGGSLFSVYDTKNPLKESHKWLAYDALESRISSLFDNNMLDYSECLFSATEYVYSFVQRFAPLLGLERRDSYSIQDIREGYYRHLQFWLSEEITEIFHQYNTREVHVRLDEFIHRETTQYEKRAYKNARIKTEEANEDPPKYRISMINFDQKTLERLIGVLVESSRESITKPYRDRDQKSPESSNIWDLYSDRAIFKNIKTYHEHYYQEYRKLVNTNFPSLSPELSKDWTNFLIVIIYRSNLRRWGWSVRWFWLESSEDDLRVECHWSSDEEVSNVSPPPVNDDYTIKYDGTEYHFSRYGLHGPFLIADIDGNSRGVFEQITKELEDEVKDYLREKKSV